ncbi:MULTISPECIES: CsbD family protein [Legionella]|uniref:Stress response protein n=1 Tax=Legionella drozanskii LLAP-1 TaxID=1212489 RepID=A0A0W0TDE4_9GAMM|nr:MULTISPECIES: CsbD family protein [Legionella]KTC93652.1 stress response protein [Legionella drozanskii LLAP-1]PJE12684.1 MAG: CsbD family protein [Legionella sp.]
MNKEFLSGKWDEIRGTLKKQWGRLTDNDLEEIRGDNLKLYGKLKQHYGLTKEQIEKELDRFKKH